MRYLGKDSVASFLGVILDIAWYFLFVIMGLIIIGALTVGIYAPNHIPQDLGHFLKFGEFISFNFSQVRIENPKSIILSILGLILLMFIVAQAVIYHLRKIFAALRVGSVFTQENARRIRAIGLISIGGAIAQSIVTSVVGLVLMNNITIPGVKISVTTNLNLSVVFIGFVILVLGEIFRQGAALQEDQNLTI